VAAGAAVPDRDSAGAAGVSDPAGMSGMGMPVPEDGANPGMGGG